MAKISIDVAELEKLIDAKVKARLASAEYQTDVPTSEEWQAGIDELKGRAVPVTPHRSIPCVSETGATFRARVVKSRGIPEGRIVALDDYAYPPGAEATQENGGLVPDGMPILDPVHGRHHTLYKQWRYETFWMVDLKALVGKPFLPRYAVEPSTRVPWSDEKSPALTEEAAE